MSYTTREHYEISVRLYRQHVGEGEIHAWIPGVNHLGDLYSDMHYRKRMRKPFCIESIEALESHEVPYVEAYSFSFVPESKKTQSGILRKDAAIMPTWGTGAVKVRYRSGDEAVFVSIPVNHLAGPNIMLCVGGDGARRCEINASLYRGGQEFGVGSWRAYVAQDGVKYEKIGSLPEVPTVHPVRDSLLEQVDFFFDHSEMYTRYGRPGTFKFMLVGPPGTGKSTLLAEIARKYRSSHAVVFATQIESAADAMTRAAKRSLPIIVMLEDAESSLSKERVNSGILNFLDGIDQPVNKAGCALIMTTNHPGEIEPRILKRPGRVDKIIEVGPLEGDYAADCARLYLPEDTKISRASLVSLFGGMTGAQIMAVAHASISKAVAEQAEVDARLIEDVSDQMTRDLKLAHKYADDDSKLIAGASGDGSALGFATIGF